MCSRPLTMADGQEVSCRSCDACIAARRFDWVSRAMAEKATAGEALVLALTYSDETPDHTAGARMFRYRDVRRFLANVRRQIAHHYGVAGAVRFLCAGEQGDRFGRCHWHIVLFSSVDLLALGEWRAPWGVVTDREDIISPNGRRSKKYRRQWSLWPWGFVTVQEPDLGGMHYALSYALKDQFAVDRSKGTARDTKGETFATGVFRMSKAPPIGWPFVEERLFALAAKVAVLPRLRFGVPEVPGYWVPRGLMRKRVLAGLRAINEGVRACEGRDTRQWSSLLESTRDNQADQEVLNGIGEFEAAAETAAEEIEHLERERKWREGEAERRRIAVRCGSTLPCEQCLASLTEAERSSLEVVDTFDDEGRYWVGYGISGEETLAAARAEKRRRQTDRKGGGLHRFCQRRGSKEVRRVFPQSGA